jgi:hypothetical protein
MSSARSNAQTRSGAASERRESERLLVVAVEQVRDPTEKLDVARHAPCRSGVDDGVARLIEQPAERSKRGIDVTRPASPACRHET